MKNLTTRTPSEVFDALTKVKKSFVLKDVQIWIEDAWKFGPKRQYIRGKTVDGQDYKIFIGMTEN